MTASSPPSASASNLDFFPEQQLKINPVTQETQLENVFAGGDAVRGASTLIKAIGDGKQVAESIKRRRSERIQDSGERLRENVGFGGFDEKKSPSPARLPGSRKSAFDERSGFDLVIRTLDEATAREEAGRCLQCDELCWVCVTVCPNRANIAFHDGTEGVQNSAGETHGRGSRDF